jgi:hypothetical protein
LEFKTEKFINSILKYFKKKGRISKDPALLILFYIHSRSD